MPERLRDKLWWRLALSSEPADYKFGWTNNSVTGACIYVTPRERYATVLWKDGQSSPDSTILQPGTNPHWEANRIFAEAYANRIELTDTLNLPIGTYYVSQSLICMQSSSDETGRTLVMTTSTSSRSSQDSRSTAPAVPVPRINIILDRTEPYAIEVASNLERIQQLYLAANMPTGKRTVSMYAEVPDTVGFESKVDLSVRFPGKYGGLATSLRLLSSVTVASVTPSRSTRPTFPETVLLLSEEEEDILNLARFTGRLVISPHPSHESDEPRIAHSPFRELNKRIAEVRVPGDTQLVAVPILDDVTGDEMSEQASAGVPSVGDFVRLTARFPLGQSYNTAAMVPQQPSSWAQSEIKPVLVQGIASTPEEFQPRYQVYLLQARKQNQAHRLQTRMHNVQVKLITAGPNSSR